MSEPHRNHRAWRDDERTTATITSAERSGDWWDIDTADGMGCALPASRVTPRVGDTLTLWGKGFGYAFRGQAINMTVVWYRSEDEQRAHQQAELEASESKQRTEYDANRADHDRRIAALPNVFAQRIAGFRERNPDFGWRFEAYELFTCEQAVAFAACCATIDALQAFHGLAYDAQRASCPAMSDQHSGNTFGAALRLAGRFIERPELVPLEHGALCPLVGCQDYGCVAAGKGMG